MTQLMTLFCAGCRAESEFEQPVCADGHGSECPDLVCVVCGLALYAFVADELRADELWLQEVRTTSQRSGVA